MMYEDGGLIPRGPSGGNYTYVMTGAATTPFITSAYLKGIRGFDLEKAYEGLRKNHFPGGMMSKAGYEHTTFKGGGIEYYIDRGYIPHPLSKITVSYTHLDVYKRQALVVETKKKSALRWFYHRWGVFRVLLDF